MSTFVVIDKGIFGRLYQNPRICSRRPLGPKLDKVKRKKRTVATDYHAQVYIWKNGQWVGYGPVMGIAAATPKASLQCAMREQLMSEGPIGGWPSSGGRGQSGANR